jgi:hypothetical protein
VKTICSRRHQDDWLLSAAIVTGVLLAGLGWALWKLSVLIPLFALLYWADRRRKER